MDLLEGNLHLSKSREYLGQEVENIVKACNGIMAQIESASGILTVSQLRTFNRAVLEGLELPADTSPPGEIRRYSVTVGRYRGAPHEDCEYLLTRLCAWLNEQVLLPSETDRIASALLRAALAHLYLAWIHPFGDGNGRTARLVEFFILVAAGVPSPAAHLLSNHYNQTRSEYYRQLQAASDSGGDVLPFIGYAARGFVDGLREQLKAIRAQQFDLTWQSFVEGEFGDRPSPSEMRQKQLVLDLGRSGDWVPTARLPTLTTRLAAAYATKQAKTVTRDLNSLVGRGLLERQGTRVRARTETIHAFLPPRKRV
jgi:Fic family protein